MSSWKINCQHIATVLWAVAIVFMAMATRDGDPWLAVWALLISQAAGAFTVSAIITHSRARLVRVIESEEQAVEMFAGTVLQAIDNNNLPRGPRSTTPRNPV